MYPNKAEEEIELVGEHAPGCFHKNVIRMKVLPKAEDYTNAMHQFVEEHAVSNGHMHDTADVIWRDTVAHFRVIGGPSFTGMSKNQVRNLVYNAHGHVFGGDVISNKKTLLNLKAIELASDHQKEQLTLLSSSVDFENPKSYARVKNCSAPSIRRAASNSCVRIKPNSIPCSSPIKFCPPSPRVMLK